VKEQNTSSAIPSRPLWDTLETFVRDKIQELVQALLEEEVTALLGRAKSVRRGAVDAGGGSRNGYGRPRRVALHAGTIVVRRPRVRGMDTRFTSQVLPLFKRRTGTVADTLRDLYLHGLALGDFEQALRGVLGAGAPLSASSIARLRERWTADYEAWRTRSLADEELVYLWADGLYVKAGLEDAKAALLVIIGVRRDGQKVILALESGQRESTHAWLQVLRDLHGRGLRPPRVVVADGHLGLWAALAQIYPTSDEQRCWNHRIVNVLDQLPHQEQPTGRRLLRDIAYAETRAEAERRRLLFARRYEARAPKAVAILRNDWDRLMSFYQYPTAHWHHLRTSNVVESPFAAVRLRTSAAKRFKKVQNATAMIWKLLIVAEQHFRRLNAPHLLAEVADGARYADGKRVVVNKVEAAA